MNNKLDINNKTQYASKASQQWLNLRLQLLGVAISSGVAFISVSLHYWSYQTIDAGLIGLALVYSLSVTSLLNGTIQSFAQTEMDMISVERVFQYIDDIEPERDYMPREDLPSDWPKYGIISYQNVCMRYRVESPLALENISFSTKAGEHVGIVGKITSHQLY